MSINTVSAVGAVFAWTAARALCAVHSIGAVFPVPPAEPTRPSWACGPGRPNNGLAWRPRGPGWPSWTGRAKLGQQWQVPEHAVDNVDDAVSGRNVRLDDGRVLQRRRQVGKLEVWLAVRATGDDLARCGCGREALRREHVGGHKLTGHDVIHQQFLQHSLRRAYELQQLYQLSGGRRLGIHAVDSQVLDRREEGVVVRREHSERPRAAKNLQEPRLLQQKQQQVEVLAVGIQAGTRGRQDLRNCLAICRRAHALSAHTSLVTTAATDPVVAVQVTQASEAV